MPGGMKAGILYGALLRMYEFRKLNLNRSVLKPSFDPIKQLHLPDVHENIKLFSLEHFDTYASLQYLGFNARQNI